MPKTIQSELVDVLDTSRDIVEDYLDLGVKSATKAINLSAAWDPASLIPSHFSTSASLESDSRKTPGVYIVENSVALGDRKLTGKLGIGPKGISASINTSNDKNNANYTIFQAKKPHVTNTKRKLYSCDSDDEAIYKTKKKTNSSNFSIKKYFLKVVLWQLTTIYGVADRFLINSVLFPYYYIKFFVCLFDGKQSADIIDYEEKMLNGTKNLSADVLALERELLTNGASATAERIEELENKVESMNEFFFHKR